VFLAPGQVAGDDDNGERVQWKGWGLCFHPDLLRGTPLGQKMKDYTFFAYEANESLHMSERERQIILNCFYEIREELRHSIDKHSKSIIAANLEVFLNHCLRFYDRQFITREDVNKDMLSRFERELSGYFESDKPQSTGLPSVQYFADQLHLSANYFGDLIRKETGKSAREYIQLKVIDKAKDKLYHPEKSVNEIAYELGFKYPHHFSRMFKKMTGCSPTDYRQMN
jgi:AraC-like DNA-binding protein